MGSVGRKQGARELVINRTPFIVVYRIKGKRIELLRLLHGSQQWPKQKMKHIAGTDSLNSSDQQGQSGA